MMLTDPVPFIVGGSGGDGCRPARIHSQQVFGAILHCTTQHLLAELTHALFADAEDRVLTTSAPAPAHGGTTLTTTYQYDPVGNRTAVIDASPQVTKYLYDARDSLAEVDQSTGPCRPTPER